MTGRARVPAPPTGDGPSTGRASVPGAAPPPARGAARAAVPGAAVPGAAVPVARAAVPAPGGAAVPVARASARVGGPPADVPPDAGAGRPSPGARAKRRRRRNVIIASIAAFIMLTGIGLVTGTYYFDRVELPDDLTLEQSTSIYYADGPLMARIGSKNRTVVTFDDIPLHVQHTISQQYARKWAELEGVTYGRKVREAVIALKLNKQYSKEQIMTMYLNIIYFGRGAHGIQAASYAYFNKSVKDLTVAEGVVLAGVIKNPSGDNDKGSPADPTVDPVKAEARFDYIRKQMVALKFVSEAEAKEKLTMPTTVITQAQTRANNAVANTALDKPEGLVVHHVLEEVAALTDPRTGALRYEDVDPQGKKNFDKVRDGGLKIISTVDSRIQQVAVQEASASSKDSNMYGQKPNLQAALVAVEPGTGAVKAYYGGDKGSGNDYAGYHVDPVLGNGQPSCCGGHPPGSTFKVYTLATALMAGYSIDSFWNGVPQDFPGRTAAQKNQIKNATEGRIPDCKSGSGTWCTLQEITVQSLNVPFYAITLELGADRVIDTARAAGITSMWATVEGEPLPVRKDLTKLSGKDVAPKFFGNEVGFGQYPITVLDHAGGMATFAARGVAVKTHFLKEVWEKEQRTFAEVLKPQRIPGFNEGMADDLTAVLQGVPEKYRLKAAHGYPLAGKTGTWQLGNTTSQGNAHAWMGGYVPHDKAKNSPGLAAAVWVGNKGDEVAIKDKENENIIGGKLPGPIWRDFLDGALTKVKMPKVSFRPSAGVGSKDVGTGVSPGPSAPVQNPTPGPNPSPGQSQPGQSPSPKTSPSPSRRN
ncbi:transglycosylase domain-containing protein [Dactylosporangium aurantiacum]|uniref:transglycosylase domain-containing protein n=1 Tax=Dactylosporangium aurantiacum TaxID=35754 RepID=UPI0012DD084C|nr:transglycosylase domain-containing protein [Dactylosporangium aurantiacum]